MLIGGLFIGCEGKGSSSESLGGDALAGESTGGSAGESAGETMSGETMSGETMSGETMSGEVAIAGELAGTGEPIAGESMAGEPTAGESIAGNTAGEPIAGEFIAGEAMAGREPSLNQGTYAYPGAVDDQWVLSNAPSPCVLITSLAPYLPDEAGHHLGGIFTPPHSPFTVQFVEYSLEEPPDIETCRSELGHSLEISVLSADQLPPTQPAEESRVHLSFEIPPAMMSTERRVIIQNLETPLTLFEGERLLVSLALDAEGSDHLCAALCDDEIATPLSTLWSGAAIPPYAWSELSSFGITAEFALKVIGQ